MSTGANDGFIWFALAFGLVAVVALGLHVAGKGTRNGQDIAFWIGLGAAAGSAASLWRLLL